MSGIPYKNQGQEDAELRELFARRAHALPPAALPSLEMILAEVDLPVSGPVSAAAPQIAVPQVVVPMKARASLAARAWPAVVAALAVAASVMGVRLTGRPDVAPEPSIKADGRHPLAPAAARPVVAPVESGEMCEAPPMTLASGLDSCPLAQPRPPVPPPSPPIDPSVSGTTCDGTHRSAVTSQREPSLTCEREMSCALPNP